MIDYKKYKEVLEIISRTHNDIEQTSVKDSICETTEQKASAICDLFDTDKILSKGTKYDGALFSNPNQQMQNNIGQVKGIPTDTTVFMGNIQGSYTSN